MTHNEVVKKLDECILFLHYYIPRITDEENKKDWIQDCLNVTIEWQVALLCGLEGWEETQERLDVMGEHAQKLINRMQRDMVK